MPTSPKKKKYAFCIISFMMIPWGAWAQTEQKLDTTKIYEIPEVIITEQYNRTETKSTSPLQILSSEKLKQLNLLQVSDAVKHFSGVTVRDYGGIGGLKTVSVRSLGANHTAINYDGVLVSDVQTGQIDIGRFSLDNVDRISLHNGQGDNIFQPARAFASSSVLNIQTHIPTFDEDKRLNGKVGMKAGSFGLINPAVNLEGKITKNISALFNGEYQYAHGQYPFTFHYGNTDDYIAGRDVRKNTDVHNLRLEGGLYGNFSSKTTAYLKAYYYQSERGLPGAIIFYNEDQYVGQRTWDKTFFTQAQVKHRFSQKLHFQVNGKYNRGWMRYLDPTYHNTEGKVDNDYTQQEYYLSASLLYWALESLSFSFSTDGAINSMTSNLEKFVNPMRYSWLTAISAKYVHERITAIGSLLGTVVNETVERGNAAKNHRRLSPYISVSAKPFYNQDFHVRVFYKNIFRLPTFNDLYYNATGDNPELSIGNTNLKPETTHQYNLGLTYNTSIGKYIPLVSLTADMYHNDVYNKIIAQPRQNIFLWSMVNYGKVSINGLDFTGEVRIQPWEKIGFTVGASHTYQRALNVTDPSLKGEYKHQIPYTPRVSGSGRAGIQTPWVNFSYSLVWSGHRYVMKQNYAINRLPGYADHSITAYRDFSFSFGTLSVSAEVLNLANKNYEIVQWFLMPGRSFRASAALKF